MNAEPRIGRVSGGAWDDLEFKILAVLLSLLVAGGFQDISSSSKLLRMVMLACLTLITLRKAILSPKGSLRPLAPVTVWMALYFIWGVIVSPVPAFELALKQGFYFLLLGGALVAITATRPRLEFFATVLQLGLVLNLAVLILSYTHPSTLQGIINPEASIASQRLITSERFVGLWGNANQAGYATLMIMVLSAWARPLLAWIGRLSGVVIIFMTASRQSLLLLVLLILLACAFTVRRKPLLMAGAALLMAGALLAFILAPAGFRVPGMGGSVQAERIFEFSDREARATGEETRGDLLKRWVPHLIRGPWYGYGLAAMCGTDSPTPKQFNQLRSDVPLLGTHNLYVGLWADVGLVGPISFLLVLGARLLHLRRRRLDTPDRWKIAALAIIFTIDGLFKHSLIFDLPGVFTLLMVFQFPPSPAFSQAHQEHSA